MAGRIRSIKPEILDDEVAVGLSDAAWRLWVSLWVLADDHGGARAGSKYLAASVWQDTSRDVDKPLSELIERGRVHPYAVGGQRYVRIHAFTRHQRVDNAGKPRVPVPEEDDGTWNQPVSGVFAASRAVPAESAASLGGPPLARRPRAHSGGQTTDHDHDHDHRPSAAAGAAEADDAKGSRLPPDWKPKDELTAWVAQQGVDVDACLEEFRDYWLSMPGARGRRSRWDLVFKSRVKSLIERGTAPRLPLPTAPRGPRQQLLPEEPIASTKQAVAAAVAAGLRPPIAVKPIPQEDTDAE